MRGDIRCTSSRIDHSLSSCAHASSTSLRCVSAFRFDRVRRARFLSGIVLAAWTRHIPCVVPRSPPSPLQAHALSPSVHPRSPRFSRLPPRPVPFPIALLVTSPWTLDVLRSPVIPPPPRTLARSLAFLANCSHACIVISDPLVFCTFSMYIKDQSARCGCLWVLLLARNYVDSVASGGARARYARPVRMRSRYAVWRGAHGAWRWESDWLARAALLRRVSRLYSG